MNDDNKIKNTSSVRRLAVILFADIVGYTSLMQTDETLALQKIKRYQSLLDTAAQQFNGQVIKNYGDGSLMIFSTSLEAVTAAQQIQEQAKTGLTVPLRIGIHLGEFIVEKGDIYGNGVNLASRIESIGIAGAVLFSKNIFQKIKNQPELKVQSLGSIEFKNVEEPLEIFALANKGFPVPKRKELQGKLKIKTENRHKWFLFAALGLVLLVAGSYFYSKQNKLVVANVIEAITIFPFDVKSANSDIHYLGEGMVDLISTKLDGVLDLHPIDPNRMFNQLRKDNIALPTLEKAKEISNTLGANVFILGNIIELNDVLQISASKYDANGRLIAKESREGQKAQLAALIDDLIKALIIDNLEKEGKELSSLAIMTSENLPALKAYLKGEQSIRRGKAYEAEKFYETAVSLDSTFSMAWYGLNRARRWMGKGRKADFDKVLQYADKIPPKWRDLVEGWRIFYHAQPGGEGFIRDLIRKYGENSEFDFLMSEWLFHINPIYGRSITEAKIWLEKSIELDPLNVEINSHWIDIAWMENDEQAIRKIMAKMPEGSLFEYKCKLRLLTMQDSITEAEIEALSTNRYFGTGYLFASGPIVEDHTFGLELGLRFEPYLNSDPFFRFVPYCLHQLKGQEKAFILLEEKDRKEKKYKSDIAGIQSAQVISSRAYLPLEEHYQYFLDGLEPYDSPLALFASAKYAWALDQEEVYKTKKQKLADASKVSHGIINPARYYHWSLAAFEAHQHGDNEKTMMYIDSVFQYSPGSYEQSHMSVMDKIFMLADIYEEQGKYEKGIQRLENLPAGSNYYKSKGYATYRLTQLYEKNGDIMKAIAKCDLLLKTYKDCDEKFRPWVEEVAERRERLIATIN
jgi:class 3 adenylate cyclase/TolB-like protein